MEVGAAKPEGADGGAAGNGAGCEPRPLFSRQVKRRPVSGQLLQGVGHLDGGRDHFVVEGEGRLDEPRSAGRRLSVPDLGLDRTEGAPGSFRLTIYLAKGADLHRVPHFGSGTVSLNQTDTFRRNPGPLTGVKDRLLLTSRTGSVDGISPAVAGGADAADNGVDSVPVPLRIGQPLDNHDAEALAESRAVRVGVERFRITAGRECRGFAETHIHEDVIERVDTAGDHHVRLARGQLHAGKVEGAERAGAGGIHDAVGPSQIILLADPAGDHVAEKPGKGVFLPGNIGVGDPLYHVFGYGIFHSGVFQRRSPEGVAEASSQGNHQLHGAGYTEDDAGPAPVIGALRSVSGIPQCLTGSHKSQELGGVDGFQDVGGDVEFQWIKRDRREEAAAVAIGQVGSFLVMGVIIRDLPVGRGDLGNGVDPLANVRPIGGRISSLREKTADTDNGQWWYCGRDGRSMIEWLDFVRFHGKYGHPKYSLICSMGRGSARKTSVGRVTP